MVSPVSPWRWSPQSCSCQTVWRSGWWRSWRGVWASRTCRRCCPWSADPGDTLPWTHWENKICFRLWIGYFCFADLNHSLISFSSYLVFSFKYSISSMVRVASWFFLFLLNLPLFPDNVYTQLTWWCNQGKSYLTSRTLWLLHGLCQCHHVLICLNLKLYKLFSLYITPWRLHSRNVTGGVDHCARCNNVVSEQTPHRCCWGLGTLPLIRTVNWGVMFYWGLWGSRFCKLMTQNIKSQSLHCIGILWNPLIYMLLIYKDKSYSFSVPVSLGPFG